MHTSKADLRREMRQRLKTLGEARALHSATICQAIAAHPAWAGARTVAMYDAMATEVHVELLWKMAPRRFVYPRIHGPALLLLEVRELTELHAVAGVRFREPAHLGERIVEPSALDVILVPGLAFSRDGHRLGRGGGYYDRLLAQLPPRVVRIGVCFESQIVEHVPHEGHDIPMHAIATEAGLTMAPVMQAKG